MRESDWSPGLCELVEEEEEDRERLLLVERYEVPRFVPSSRVRKPVPNVATEHLICCLNCEIYTRVQRLVTKTTIM